MDEIDTHEQTNEAQFLQNHINTEALVSVFLVSGLQLKGILIGFDSNTLFLKNSTNTQLIYKHAVATVMQQKNK